MINKLSNMFRVPLYLTGMSNTMKSFNINCFHLHSPLLLWLLLLLLLLLLVLLFSSSLWLLLPLFEFEHQSLQARRVVGPVTTREREDAVATEVLSSLSRELFELVSMFNCLVRSRRARSRDERGGVFSSSPAAETVPDPTDVPPPCNYFMSAFEVSHFSNTHYLWARWSEDTWSKGGCKQCLKLNKIHLDGRLWRQFCYSVWL